MVEGDDTGVLTLEWPKLDPDATAVLPIISADDIPWIEPRRYDANGPVWDATDELYITYDEEGGRELITNGDGSVWNQHHNYQRTGSARYRTLAGDTGDPRVSGGTGRVGGVDRRPAKADGSTTIPLPRTRPGWAESRAQEVPQVHPDRDRVHARGGPGSRARSRAADDGKSTDGAKRHRRDQVGGSRVPERPRSETGIRSHKHCPGCTGHSWVNQSWWSGAIRLFAAIWIGWLGLWISGVAGAIGLSHWEYLVLVTFGITGIVLGRDTLRERKVL